jgi:VanZ family protein
VITRWASWIGAVVLAGWLWWMSSRPVGQSDLPEHTDKLIHAATWAVLAALLAAGGLAASSARSRAWPRRWVVVAAIAVAVAYGAVDEWHQSYVPTRDSSLADLVADAIGAIAGAAAIGYGRRHGDRP